MGSEQEKVVKPRDINIYSLRTAVDSLRGIDGQVLETDETVDNDLEFAGIQKRLDGGPGLLFNSVEVAGRAYPDVRLVTNLFSKESRIHRMFGFDDATDRTRKIARAMNDPIPPEIVSSDEAPVHHTVVTDEIDVYEHIPPMRHSTGEDEFTLGTGCGVVHGRFFDGGSHVGYNRMNFRWDDVSTINIAPGSHMWMIAKENYGKEKIPFTMNFGIPPALYAISASGFDYPILPKGCDEAGIAGALQGAPIELVEAKTVDDAYAVANAEMTLEGYVDPEDRRYETAEAEEHDEQGEHPFHPEWPGYMGNAWKTPTFHVTGLTKRDPETRPLIHQTIVHVTECDVITGLLREGAFYELCNRIQPGIVSDVHVPFSMTSIGGMILEIDKKIPPDEGYQRNMMISALGASPGLRFVIAVDDDIDIYNADDIMWAISTRVNPQDDVLNPLPGGAGQAFQPSEGESGFEGGLVIDATVPVDMQDEFQRAEYPVDHVELTDWFDEEDVDDALDDVEGWVKFLAEKGW